MNYPQYNNNLFDLDQIFLSAGQDFQHPLWLPAITLTMKTLIKKGTYMMNLKGGF